MNPVSSDETPTPHTEGKSKDLVTKNTDPAGQAEATRQAAHSPEPWISVAHKDADTAIAKTLCPWMIDEVDGYRIAYVLGDVPDLDAKANTERIVACVNACAGIKNPAAIKQLIESATNFTSDWAKSVNREKLWRDLDNSLAALETPVPDARQTPAASREKENSRV